MKSLSACVLVVAHGKRMIDSASRVFVFLRVSLAATMKGLRLRMGIALTRGHLSGRHNESRVGVIIHQSRGRGRKLRCVVGAQRGKACAEIVCRVEIRRY